MTNEGERKVHWLGFSNGEYLRAYRPFSCDSASWNQAQMYGVCNIYLGHGRFEKFRKGDLTGHRLAELAPRVRRYGYDIFDLTRAGAWNGDSVSYNIAVASWVDFSLDLMRSLKTRLSLPIMSKYQLCHMLTAFDRLKGGFAMDQPKLRVLIAFPYFTPDMVAPLKERGDDVAVLIDSGAFTAWKAGTTIAMDDYCRFLETLPIKPWRYFMLDVVGDPEATLRNYAIMLERGFKPVPIFTRGMDPKVLDYYYETTDLVGVGGLVGTRGNRGFVNGIMERVNGRKVHLLGFKSAEHLRFWRPFSCDSTNWMRGVKYMRNDVYLGSGHMGYLLKKNIERLVTPALTARIARYGLDVYRLRDPREWHNREGMMAQVLGCASWVDYSLDAARSGVCQIFLAASWAYEVKRLTMFFDRLAPLYREKAA